MKFLLIRNFTNSVIYCFLKVLPQEIGQNSFRNCYTDKSSPCVETQNVLLNYQYRALLLRIGIIGLITASICLSQNITISGKVTDGSGGTPLEGAVVKLEKYGLTSTTNTDGDFTLSGSVGIHTSKNYIQHNIISARKGHSALHVTLRKRSAVEIDAFTLQGKNVFKKQNILERGIHTIALPSMGTGVYVYRIKAGADELILKSPSICRISGSSACINHGLTHTTSGKQPKPYESINDVIAVAKDGYLDYRVVVTNSDTNGIEIKMIASAGTVTDVDGNVYQSVKIGNQVWTVENLRTTRYNDGSPIPLDTSSASWDDGDGEKYCYYNNTTHTDSIKKYGALYNWNAVNTGKLAPEGWHVPDKGEWETLQNYLVTNGYNWDGSTDSNRVAKSLAAKADWFESLTNGAIGCDVRANNSTGFSALPGGFRFQGHFIYTVHDGFWWSSTQSSQSWLALYCRLLFSKEGVRINNTYKGTGMSVRLVRSSAKNSPDPSSAGRTGIVEKADYAGVNKANDSYTNRTYTHPDALSTSLMIPDFEPVFWSEDGFVRDWNNCYNYANNRRTDTYASPGEASGQEFNTLTCLSIDSAVLRDGLETCTDITQPIPPGKARIALCVNPGTDFHWYREDRNGMWSHKIGKGKALNRDNSGQPISDPEKADRGGYTDFCGYYFVYSDSLQGRGREHICRRAGQISVDKSTLMKVTIMMYSGRRDPCYYINDEKMFYRIKALLDKAEAINNYSHDIVEPSQLGYRGIQIQINNAKQLERYVLFNNCLEHTSSCNNLKRKRFLHESSQTLKKILIDEAFSRDIIDDEEFLEISDSL